VGSLIKTKIDALFQSVQIYKKIFVAEEAKKLSLPASSIIKMARYLEQLGFVEIDFRNIKGTTIIYKKSPEHPFMYASESEILDKLKFFKGLEDTEAAGKYLYNLYDYARKVDEPEFWTIYTNARTYYMVNFITKYMGKKIEDPLNMIDNYTVQAEGINITVDIIKQELEAVPFYIISLLRLSEITEQVIEKIKSEIIGDVAFNMSFKDHDEEHVARRQYKKILIEKLREVFPDLQESFLQMINEYVVITSLGMGEIEFLLKDKFLEEIVINSANQPIWVFHKKHGWLETNIIVEDEAKTDHYAMLAGRVVDKTITALNPLMDAHLITGDRVNATLKPISSNGNTVTIRKFAEQPWTITTFLQTNTIDYYTAAMVWTAIQYEQSILIVGGTGSGKTSTLNVFSIFIPPNQRVISIEDTRELRLPKTLHWVPMETKMPNPEGKGGVTMLDLMVNSLRMRPDRIIVGEIRRKNEAEVMFEAMHTGHSVYATLHANTVQETITRLTTDPLGISKSLLSAVDLIFVQNRNRRTNTRRTFQVAELKDDGNFNLLMQYNYKKDALERVNVPVSFYKNLELVSGLTKQEVDAEIQEKMAILMYLVKNNIILIDDIALIMKNYYVNKKYLMNKLFGVKNK